MKQWSRKFKECKQCGCNGRPHKGGGLCILCYDKLRAKTPNGRANQKRYRENNRQKIRQIQRDYYYRIREKMFLLLGNKCCKCGFDDRRALQIDHIKGGGVKERRKYNTKDFHRLVLKSVENKENKYQLLCANCNWIKRFTNNEIKLK